MASKAAAKPAEQMSNNNLIIVMLLITFLVLGASGLVAKALIGSIILDQKVVAAKGLADKNLQKDVDAAPKLVDAYTALGSQAGELADALPNTSDLPGLLVVLENMMNDAGMRMKSVVPVLATDSGSGASASASTDTSSSPTATSSTSGDSDASQAPSPQPYDFSITFDGRYDTLLKMLDHLEKSARPMRVTGLQVTGGGSALSGTIDVETYYQDKAQLPFSTETIK